VKVTIDSINLAVTHQFHGPSFPVAQVTGSDLPCPPHSVTVRIKLKNRFILEIVLDILSQYCSCRYYGGSYNIATEYPIQSIASTSLPIMAVIKDYICIV
jgi:hypothetical protein